MHSVSRCLDSMSWRWITLCSTFWKLPAALRAVLMAFIPYPLVVLKFNFVQVHSISLQELGKRNKEVFQTKTPLSITPHLRCKQTRTCASCKTRTSLMQFTWSSNFSVSLGTNFARMPYCLARVRRVQFPNFAWELESDCVISHSRYSQERSSIAYINKLCRAFRILFESAVSFKAKQLKLLLTLNKINSFALHPLLQGREKANQALSSHGATQI